MQRSNEAIQLSSRAIELDPNNHVAYMLLCWDYASDFQYENAEKAAKKSVSLKPDYGMGQNALFNALAMQEDKKEELKNHNKNYEFYMYEGAGHGFFAVDRPGYRQHAATDGWEKVLAFYARHLGQGGGSNGQHAGQSQSMERIAVAA